MRSWLTIPVANFANRFDWLSSTVSTVSRDWSPGRISVLVVLTKRGALVMLSRVAWP